MPPNAEIYAKQSWPAGKIRVKSCHIAHFFNRQLGSKDV